MAASFVQGETNSSASTTSATVTLPAAPTSGNLLVAWLSHGGSARATGTPSGSGWSVAVTVSGGGGTARGGGFWWKAAGAGESATITYSAVALTAPWVMTIVEYSGVDTSGTAAAAAANLVGSGTAYATTAITPAAAQAGVAIMIAHERSVTSSSAWSGHTWGGSSTGVTARVNNGTNNQAGTTGYGTAWDFIGTLPTAATTANATAPATDVGTTVAVAFNAAAGGGSPAFVPGMGPSRRPRRPVPRRRVATTTPPPAQAGPAVTLRGLFGKRPAPRLARERGAVPPLATAVTTARGLILRGGSGFGVREGKVLRGGIPLSTTGAAAPAFPFAAILRRLRGIPAHGVHHVRAVSKPSGQAAPAASPIVPTVPKSRANRALRLVQGGAAAPVPADQAVLDATPSRRALALRRLAGPSASTLPPPPPTPPTSPTVGLTPRPWRRGKTTTGTTPPQFNPPIVAATDAGARLTPRPWRRGKTTTGPIPPQLNPPIVPSTDVGGRPTGRMLRRGRVTGPVVEQAAPPPGAGGKVRVRRPALAVRPRARTAGPRIVSVVTAVRGLLLRGGSDYRLRGPADHLRAGNPGTTAGPAPAFPFSALVRRLRGIPAHGLHHARSAQAPAGQAAPAVNPAFPLATARGLRRFLTPARRARVTAPTPAQQAPGNPPYPLPVARGLRRLLTPSRRPRAAGPVHGQPTAPVHGPQLQRRRVEPAARRGRTWQVTPPQSNPPYPVQPLRVRRWAAALRRPAVRALAPEQVVPLAEQPLRRRPFLPRRGRVAAAPAIQVQAPGNPPYPLAVARGVRRFLAPARRGHVATPTPQQAAAANPPYPLAVARGLRRFLTAARRGRAAGPVPPQPAAPGATQLAPGRRRRAPQPPRRRGVDVTPAPAATDLQDAPQRHRQAPPPRRRPVTAGPPQQQPAVAPVRVPQPARRPGLRALVARILPRRVASVLGVQGVLQGPVVVTDSTGTTVTDTYDSRPAVTGTYASSPSVAGAYGSTTDVAPEPGGDAVAGTYDSSPVVDQ